MSNFIIADPALFLKPDSAETSAGTFVINPPILYSQQKISGILPLTYAAETESLPTHLSLAFGLRALLDQGSGIRVCYSTDRKNWFGSFVPSGTTDLEEYPEEDYLDELYEEDFRAIGEEDEFAYFAVCIPTEDLDLPDDATEVSLFVDFIFESRTDSSPDQYVEIDEELLLDSWGDGGEKVVNATTPPKPLR